MTTITALHGADEADWRLLWQAYLTFYETELSEDVTLDVFARLVAGRALHGAIARGDDGRAIGFVHWLFHPSTWSIGPYCYLEDLFVDPQARGGGVGRALIDHVTERAREAGAAKVYWLTQENNTRARALYDLVAESTGFVHYERDV